MQLPKIKPLAPDFTEVRIGRTALYFSYETLIAFAAEGTTFKDTTRYSNTTTRQINKHLPDAEELSPEEFQAELRAATEDLW